MMGPWIPHCLALCPFLTILICREAPIHRLGRQDCSLLCVLFHLPSSLLLCWGRWQTPFPWWPRAVLRSSNQPEPTFSSPNLPRIQWDFVTDSYQWDVSKNDVSHILAKTIKQWACLPCAFLSPPLPGGC